MRRRCLLVTCAALCGCLAMAQSGGRITGTVLDEDSQLVTDAKLCLGVKSGNNTSINCGIARADKNGQFRIENLKSGTYNVFAVNEGEGYSIENQSPGEEVVLTSENLAPQITVRLRPRGGVLLGHGQVHWTTNQERVGELSGYRWESQRFLVRHKRRRSNSYDATYWM